MQRSSKVLIFIDCQYWVLGEQGPLNPLVLTEGADGQQRHVIEVNQAAASQIPFVSFDKLR